MYCIRIYNVYKMVQNVTYPEETGRTLRINRKRENKRQSK